MSSQSQVRNSQVKKYPNSHSREFRNDARFFCLPESRASATLSRWDDDGRERVPVASTGVGRNSVGVREGECLLIRTQLGARGSRNHGRFPRTPACVKGVRATASIPRGKRSFAFHRGLLACGLLFGDPPCDAGNAHATGTTGCISIAQSNGRTSGVELPRAIA